jgi:elongation factor Ts
VPDGASVALGSGTPATQQAGGTITIATTSGGVTGATGGHLDVLGTSVVGLTPDRVNALGVSRTFQQTKLFDGLTIRENVMVGGHRVAPSTFLSRLVLLPRAGRAELEHRERADRCLALVGLDDRRDDIAVLEAAAAQDQTAACRAHVPEHQVRPVRRVNLCDAGGDFEAARELLRTKGLAGVEKRAGRSADQGLVESYVHFNGSVGALAEVNCETDFVANTDEFKQLARDIVLHIASAAPVYAMRDEVPADRLDAERRIYEAQAKDSGKPDSVIPKIVEGKLNAFYEDVVLLDQPFVKDDKKSIGQLIDEVAAKVGERVAVRRFVRYKLGEEAGGG